MHECIISDARHTWQRFSPRARQITEENLRRRPPLSTSFLRCSTFACIALHCIALHCIASLPCTAKEFRRLLRTSPTSHVSAQLLDKTTPKQLRLRLQLVSVNDRKPRFGRPSPPPPPPDALSGACLFRTRRPSLATCSILFYSVLFCSILPPCPVAATLGEHGGREGVAPGVAEVVHVRETRRKSLEVGQREHALEERPPRRGHAVGVRSGELQPGHDTRHMTHDHAAGREGGACMSKGGVMGSALSWLCCCG